MHRIWAQGGTAGGGAQLKNCQRGGDFRGRCNGTISEVNGRMDGNASSFVSIIPPGVGIAFYRWVVCRGMGGGTERSAGIN